MSTVRRTNPPAVHPPLGRYHHATVHPLGNGLKRLVMAGQVGIKPDGTLAGDLGAQIEQAICRAAGLPVPGAVCRS